MDFFAKQTLSNKIDFQGLLETKKVQHCLTFTSVNFGVFQAAFDNAIMCTGRGFLGFVRHSGDTFFQVRPLTQLFSVSFL